MAKEKDKEKKKKKEKDKEKDRSRSKSKSRSKSPGKNKSRSNSRARSKSKTRSAKNGGWWDLNNDPELLAALEAEGLRELARIQEEETLMARRAEIIRNFKEAHAEKMRQEEEERRANKRGVAQRFLQQVQTKERETKPVILLSVRASPLKLDISKWEAPKYKKDDDEKTILRAAAKKHFLFKETNKAAALKKNSISDTNTIAANTVAMMIKAFEPVQVDKGKTIIEQGKKDDHMYVIQKGTVDFEVDGKKVETGGVGATFGDQNLLHSVPAKAAVVATESTKVFRLHQDTYRGILQQRHIVEDVKRKQKEEEKAKKEQEKAKKEQEKAKKEGKKAKPVVDKKKPSTELDEWWKDNENVQLQLAIRDALRKVHEDDLERIRQLGEGQFGDVWLVSADLETSVHPEPREYKFALKMQETFDDFRAGLASSEIKIMKAITGHPFVSMLYRSYESEENMDMVLGLIPGGELWDTIHKEIEETGEWESGLSEGDSRFYAMLVADTLDYLHSRNYVYRDLKPENIMIDGWGYPVIVDFGFTKKLKKGRTDKTFTFCGTPNYVSPEIVKNIGHNGAADCWALGIVIYEMISGENPFYWDDMEQMELYKSICEDPPEPLDEKLHSRQVRRLIDKLLVKDPSARMNARTITEQPWFEGLSLEKLRQRKIRAPRIPEGGEGEFTEYEEYVDTTGAKEAEDLAKKREKEVEEELRRLQEEKEERERLEAEERQRELEEQLRREEEERLEQERLEEEERQRELEEQLRREEEERLEQERLEQEGLEEEERQRELEEQRRLEEEERLEQERLEQERLEEEERLYQEELARLEEEERLEEERLEQERLEQERLEQERLEEEERQRQEEEEQERLRLIEKQRIKEEEEERRRYRQEDPPAMTVENNYSRDPVSPRWVAGRQRSRKELVSDVPDGIVERMLNDSRTRSPGSSFQSPGSADVKRSVKKGLVAKRLSAAKEKDQPGNIPSLFASFSAIAEK